MVKRLTEEMVIARTKISDLGKIKRLNCWGSELSDVSLLRKMPAVEVLSLSINKINSLADFQLCKRLEELYIRQNEIEDINQVIYLQNLPNLKNLWLGENPCAKVEGYRLAVLKALPQIQKLDNVPVSPEELKEAQKRGKNLVHPEDRAESEEDDYIVQQQNYSNNRYAEYPEPEYSPTQRISPRQEIDYEVYESGECYTRDENSGGSREFSPPRQMSPPRQHIRTYSPEAPPSRTKNSYERESPKQQYYNKSPPASNSFEETSSPTDNCHREPRLLTSQSANCIKEYSNGDRYGNANTYRQADSNSEGNERRERYVCSASTHRPPFNRRPVTRNSNILSAVLCLVKELDYPSLEVVEMAVRCRMDELDE
ncbi:dynein axonemal assembly factor 11 isoform X1 [Coccinella septempunctata]|uniref:dynein axonemal assembly factor 11 isoform X1 n=1 Tax=Coccinella septempunctata TaxID=41139 RepID=UPI001D085B00|nr:dynein axonemal assembly factor 11 isoform X1 [Coccinella septempunctata]